MILIFASLSRSLTMAGADIVLGPQNFVEAFDAVVKAVETAGSPSSASTRACAAY